MSLRGASQVAHQSKESASNAGEIQLDPWVGKIPWRRKYQPTPIFLPRKSHGKATPHGFAIMTNQRQQMSLKAQNIENNFMCKGINFINRYL